MTTASQTSTTGRSDSLCELCSRALALDDSRIGATWKTSSDGTIGTLSFPVDDWEHQEDRSAFRRTVTNPNLPELSGPIAETCCFCTAIKKALLNRYENSEWWSFPVVKIPITIEYFWRRNRKLRVGGSEERPLYYLVVNACPPGEGSRPPSLFEKDISFPIAASKGQCRDWLGIKRDPVDLRSPMSDGNIRLVRRWLDECTMDEGCNEIRDDKNFVPKRLLDLGLSGELEPPILIHTTESPPKPTAGEDNLRYACLSYCWGSGSLPLRTTSQTLAQHEQGIPVDELPQVFRDAILVARELGLRYLWIDALCIIQDDVSDWEEESGRMGDIFLYSFITFGAATSSACDETFLQRKEVDFVDLHFRSSLNPDVSGCYSVSLSPEDESPHLEQEFRGSIWNTRGWVWQEQHMSQRILIFGPRKLYLRCHRRVLSDNGCRLDESDLTYGLQPSNLSSSDLIMWMSWVKEYSGRKFTHASDKLAAASSIAKSLQKVIEREGEAPTYLAGLWLDHTFHAQLWWILDGNHPSFGKMMESLENNESYCAPSWSWASRDQAVTGADGMIWTSKKQDFELVRHNLIPAKSDTMVKINPGSSITVQGKLLRIPRRPSNGAFIPETRDLARMLQEHWELRKLGGRIKCFLDWDPHMGYDGDPESLLHLFVTSVPEDDSDEDYSLYSDFLEADSIKPKSTFFKRFSFFKRFTFFKNFPFVKRSSYINESDYSTGLILYPIGTKAVMHFVRVGTFRVAGVSVSSWPVREVTIF